MPTLTCDTCETSISMNHLHEGEPCVQSDCNGLLLELPAIVRLTKQQAYNVASSLTCGESLLRVKARVKIDFGITVTHEEWLDLLKCGDGKGYIRIKLFGVCCRKHDWR